MIDVSLQYSDGEMVSKIREKAEKAVIEKLARDLLVVSDNRAMVVYLNNSDHVCILETDSRLTNLFEFHFEREQWYQCLVEYCHALK